MCAEVTATSGAHDARHEQGRPGAGERSSAMSMIDRIRRRRMISRQNRAIDRAMQSAPTQAMRDEIAFFSQRQPF